MSHPIYTVDAFTRQAFSGNPAAVCLLKEPGDADWMQQVAAEMNLSETAFLHQTATGEWNLRWFTPKVEVDLCGHATLASAHVLWQRGETVDRLSFQTRSGILTAVREGDAIRLDFPAQPAADSSAPSGLTEALGVTPQYVGRSRDDVLVVVDDAQTVIDLKPDFARLTTIDARGVMVTAPGDNWGNHQGIDFVSRFFAPRVGIPEDPVTGSAHCCLTPYWAERLGKTELRAVQASARVGELTVRLKGERVELVGHAATTLEGQFLG